MSSSRDNLKPKSISSDVDDVRNALRQVSQVSSPEIDEEFTIEIDSTFAGRRLQNNEDRLLAKFFAACLVAIGLLTLLPTIYFWITSAQPVDPTTPVMPLARWAYILGFITGLHLIYSVYIYQVVDFGALDALAAFLLVVTCVYGFAGMSLALTGAESQVARFLQLPSSWIQRSTMWIGIMFGVSALACYLIGREARIWRRRQVLAKSKSRNVVGANI